MSDDRWTELQHENEMLRTMLREAEERHHAAREPLDVELLAKAIEKVSMRQSIEAAAVAIAAEYARLAQQREGADLTNHTQEADANGVWCREDGQRWPCDAVVQQREGADVGDIRQHALNYLRSDRDAVQQREGAGE